MDGMFDVFNDVTADMNAAEDDDDDVADDTIIKNEISSIIVTINGAWNDRRFIRSGRNVVVVVRDGRTWCRCQRRVWFLACRFSGILFIVDVLF